MRTSFIPRFFYEGFGNINYGAPDGGSGGGTVSAANNGLSLLGANTVVLGQDVGAAGNPALVSNNREIPFVDTNTTIKLSNLQFPNFYALLGAYGNKLVGDSTQAPVIWTMQDALIGAFAMQIGIDNTAGTQRAFIGTQNTGLTFYGLTGNAVFDNAGTSGDDGVHFLQVRGTAGFYLPENGAIVEILDYGNVEITSIDGSAASMEFGLHFSSVGKMDFVFQANAIGGTPHGIINFGDTLGGGAVIDFSAARMLFTNDSLLPATDTGALFQFWGDISTHNPVTGLAGKWKLGQFDATAPVPTGRIKVTVDGVDYWIAAQVA